MKIWNAVKDVVDNGPNRPVARSTDPGTSWEAAKSIKDASITLMKTRIIDMLVVPMIDQNLVNSFEARGWSGTPSGIRSRRSELERVGLVRCVGKSHTLSGRKCRVFQAVPTNHFEHPNYQR